MSETDAADRRTGRAEVVRRVFEELPVILGAVEGPEHRYIASNAAHRRLLQHSDFIGRSMLEVNPEWRDQEVQLLMDLAYRTGTVQRAKEWHLFIAEPDGTMREAYVDATLVPRFDAAGEVEGINSFTFDVTELVQDRKRAEQQAAEAEERFRRTNEDVLTLQRALLPPGLPILPEAELAAAYLLAQQATAAGGDWFDALRTPDGHVALVVGDVVGNGVAASAIMGQLRAVLEERLSSGADLSESLAAVDRMATRIPEGRAATVCVGLLDPATGQLRYCTAGHPPPLVIEPDGSSRYLPASAAAPLGTGGPLTIAEATLREGAAIVLYSDGLLERPSRTPEQSMGELAAAAAGIMTPARTERAGVERAEQSVWAERVSRQTVELLVRSTGYSDDITVLTCRRVPAPQPLVVTAAATSDAVPLARRALRDWLRRCEVPESLILLILHAAGELVSNAVLEAYRGFSDRAAADDAVRLTATLRADGCVDIEVSDRGRWREPQPDPHRLHGLDMVADLAEELRFSIDAEGTTARATFRPTRPARMLDPRFKADLSPVPWQGDDTLLIMRHLDDAGIALVLDGPLDLSTAEALRQEAQRAIRQRPAAVALDLTRVSLLSSAGVALLHDLRDACAADGIGFGIAARDGTVAAFILDLVRLPRDASLR